MSRWQQVSIGCRAWGSGTGAAAAVRTSWLVLCVLFGTWASSPAQGEESGPTTPATLSLSVFPDDGVDEYAGTNAATGTLTLSTALDYDLTVTLWSDDPIATPAESAVTIAAGETSTDFAIDTWGNGVIDGHHQVTIVASADGFGDLFASLVVWEDDFPEIELTVAPAVFPKTAGTDAATATIRLCNETPLDMDLSFTLWVDGHGVVTVPSAVVLPAGSTSVSFPVNAVDNQAISGDSDEFVFACPEILPDYWYLAQVTVTDGNAPLSLVLSPASFQESAGTEAAVGTVSIPAALPDDLVVPLSTYGDTAAIVIPESVTIPAGSTSTTFAIEAVDDTLATGDRSVRILAYGPVQNGMCAVVNGWGTVLDDDVPGLTLSLSPDSFAENAGATAATLTVTRNTPADMDLSVSLSSNGTALVLPDVVTIPAGESTATAAVGAVDDQLVNGSRTILVTATAADHESGHATVTVTDNDLPTLTLTVSPASFLETGGPGAAVGTVSLATALSSDLLIALASIDNNCATVPDTVTILAGSISATFTVGAVDDDLASGDRGNVISACPGVQPDASVAFPITVLDDDTPQLTMNLFPSILPENAGTDAATLTLTRNTPVTDALTVNLSSSDPGAVSLPAAVTIPAGASTVRLALAVVDDSVAQGDRMVQIDAATSSPAMTGSDALGLQDDDLPALSLTLSPTAFPENAGASAATGTITRNTPADSALTVSLSSSESGAATVPETVVIPAGESAVTFAVAAVGDGLANGDRVTLLNASANGLAGASMSVLVTDTDSSQDPPGDATVQLSSKRHTKSEWQSSGTTIAAGGIDTDVHKADILIGFSGLPSGTRVEVCLLGEGGGCAVQNWAFTVPAKKAVLTINGQTYTHGNANPLVFTSPTELQGELLSSNRQEATRVAVAIPSLGIRRSLLVQFVSGQMTVAIATPSEIPTNTWHGYSVVHRLDDDVISGHELKLAVTTITYVAEDGTRITKTPTIGGSLSECASLANYVQLDPEALFNHDYFCATSGSEGVTSTMYVVDPRVEDIHITAFDFSVWQ